MSCSQLHFNICKKTGVKKLLSRTSMYQNQYKRRNESKDYFMESTSEK